MAPTVNSVVVPSEKVTCTLVPPMSLCVAVATPSKGATRGVPSGAAMSLP